MRCAIFPALLALSCAGCRPTSRSSRPDYQGNFGEVANSQIIGWAWDPANPDSAIEIEVLDGDRHVMTTNAGVYLEAYEKSGLGNGKHGFHLPLPLNLKDGKHHSIHVRFAGTKVELPGSPKSLIATSFEGHLGSVSSNGISGWAWDEATPNLPLNVEILEAEKLIATVRADLYRDFLRDAGKGDGRHGFHSPLPANFKDGKPHMISARLAHGKQELAGIPQTVMASPLEGRISGMTNSSIFGWAWDAGAPNDAVEVEILRDDDALIGTITADIYRENLKSAGLGDGKHGFLFQLPNSLKDGTPHSIRARILGTTTELANSLTKMVQPQDEQQRN